MRSRVILFFICACLAMACKNEPYEYPPLGIVGLVDHVANVTNTYRYRDQKLLTFYSANTDTIVYRKFFYTDNVLQTIVSDSTKAFKNITTFYRNGTETVVDSTRRVGAGTSVLVGTRSITYLDGNPTSVTVNTIDGATVTTEVAELTWENENVVRLALSKITFGTKVPVSDLEIYHDDQSCIYMKNPDYLFTLPLAGLYWLSKNNPRSFNDGTGEKKWTYWYNKLGYPSNFKSETGVLYGVTYTQIREN